MENTEKCNVRSRRTLEVRYLGTSSCVQRLTQLRMSGSRRLLLLGDSAVGKTSLLHRVMDDTFTPNFISTVGIDFRDRTMTVRGVAVKLRIWDTAGQERFRTITSQFYRGSQGILLCYDITNVESFRNVNHWLQQIRKNADVNIQIALVGNKKDRVGERRVSMEEGRAMATKYELKHFFETSAKSGDGVELAFQALTELVVAQFRVDGAPNDVTVLPTEELAADAKNGCVC